MNTSIIDFDIHTEKLVTETGCPTNKVAVMRNDTSAILGINSAGFKVLDHRPVFAAGVKAMVGEAGFELRKLEVGGNGARMFAQFTNKRVTEEVQVGDMVQLMITLMNGYDGTTKLGYMIEGLVLKCLNGMIAPIRFLNVQIRHTANAEIGHVMNQAQEATRAFRNEAMPLWRGMTGVRGNTALMLKTIEEAKIIPEKLTTRVKERIVAANYANHDISLWDLYNHYTYLLTHEYKGSPERRMNLQLMTARLLKNEFIIGGKE